MRGQILGGEAFLGGGIFECAPLSCLVAVPAARCKTVRVLAKHYRCLPSIDDVS